ncbi:MAG: hypothetical protein GPJ54_18815 [Candidatus Heimdallarchaeota archaeon]|nr:hypothetical protein [Candidatus Heimdallarchaeota archaeon]
MSSYRSEPTYSGIMLSLSIILQVFVIFTPMLFLIPNNSESNGNTEYLREVLPFPLFMFYILSVIGSFYVLMIVFISSDTTTGNFHSYILRTGVVMIIIAISATHFRHQNTDDGLWIKTFGYFILWLALWFKIIAMVLFGSEDRGMPQYASRSIIYKSKLTNEH